MASSTRHVLRPEEREMVYNVYQFFKWEKENKIAKFGIDQAVKRAADATKISKTTLHQICKEAKETEEEFGKPVFREKKRKRSKTVTNLDDVDLCVIRRTVLDFYARKEIPTIDKVLQQVIENIGFGGCKESFRKVLHEMGFSYKKLSGRQILLERSDITSARTKFLRKINKLNETGEHSYIYLDETWVNQNHTVGKCWQDQSSEHATGVKPQTGKGSRLIVLHAGSKAGFVPNAELVFQAKHADADYHCQMNTDVFKKWFIKQLLPNIPPASVIIMDNDSYHSVQTDTPPTMSNTKSDMRDWLSKKGVNPPDYLTKCELFEIVKSMKNSCDPKYVIDDIAIQNGHQILRLPPYHGHYNPIELIWTQVKNYVSSKNNFKMKDLKVLLHEALASVTTENWSKAVNLVEEIVSEDIKNDVCINEFIESFVTDVTSSDEESP